MNEPSDSSASATIHPFSNLALALIPFIIPPLIIVGSQSEYSRIEAIKEVVVVLP